MNLTVQPVTARAAARNAPDHPAGYAEVGPAMDLTGDLVVIIM